MGKKSSNDAELVFTVLYKVVKFFFTGIKGVFIMLKDIYNLIAKGFEKNMNNSHNTKNVKVDTNVVNESLLNNREESMSDYDKELEQRMNDLDLEDWQKELVRNGEYDPENFEEDDSLDDDDYYHEDDE